MNKNYLPSLIFICVIISSCGGGGSSSDSPSVSTNNTSTGTNSTTTPNNACIVSPSGAPQVSQQKMWPHYSSDQFATRYIDSDKLDKDNFSNLTISWTWEAPSERFMDQNPSLTANRNAATPIMIDGVIGLNNLIKGLRLVSDYLEKSILKPNNLNIPNSRTQFLNILK